VRVRVPLPAFLEVLVVAVMFYNDGQALQAVVLLLPAPVFPNCCLLEVKAGHAGASRDKPGYIVSRSIYRRLRRGKLGPPVYVGSRHLYRWWSHPMRRTATTGASTEDLGLTRSSGISRAESLRIRKREGRVWRSVFSRRTIEEIMWKLRCQTLPRLLAWRPRTYMSCCQRRRKV